MATGEGKSSAGLITGIFALLVALASAWSGAETGRAEAIRAERREAYAALIGTTHSCYADAIASPYSIKDLKDLPTGTKRERQLLRVLRLGARTSGCAERIDRDAALASLVAGDDVVNAVHSVAISTIAVIGADPTEAEVKRYISSQAGFTEAARSEVTRPFVSRLVIFLTIAVVAYVGLVGLVLWLYPKRRPATTAAGEDQPVADGDD